MANNVTVINVACPPDRGPDLLFRFPLGPFNEPYGQDCYFSRFGWNVFGGITLALTFVCLWIHLASLQDERNRLFLAVRIVQTVVLGIACALIIVGFVAPEQTYILGSLFLIMFMSTALLWNVLGYRTIVKIVVNVRLNKDVTVLTLMGGPVIVYGYCVMRTLTHLTECSALIALAIAKSHGDIHTTTICFRLTCSCIAIDLVTFTIGVLVLFTKFLSMIELALVNVRDATNQYEESLKDIVQRFKVARALFGVFTPLTAVILALNATILPLFWFLILVHLIAVANGCFAVFVAITTRAKRRMAVRRMFLGWIVPLIILTHSDGIIANQSKSMMIAQGKSQENNRQLLSPSPRSNTTAAGDVEITPLKSSGTESAPPVPPEPNFGSAENSLICMVDQHITSGSNAL